MSAERALSGQGLVNLYGACCDLEGRAAEPLGADEVTTRALAGNDPTCSLTVDLFFGFLGTTAGNLALTFGAHGGIYIGGGIVPRLGARIEQSRFRAQFESKGRFAAYLEHIPTWVIRSEFPPALIGAARAFDVFE